MEFIEIMFLFSVSSDLPVIDMQELMDVEVEAFFKTLIHEQQLFYHSRIERVSYEEDRKQVRMNCNIFLPVRPPPFWDSLETHLNTKSLETYPAAFQNVAIKSVERNSSPLFGGLNVTMFSATAITA